VAGVVLLDPYWSDSAPPPDLLRAVLLAAREREHALGLADVGVRRVAAMGAYTAFLEGWTPSPLAAPTLVVRARDPIAGTRTPTPALVWPLPHTLFTTPGDHLTMMTEHAVPLASAVESWLAESAVSMTGTGRR
jgi:polyketide synthase 12